MLEFRSVSFTYPSSEISALEELTFAVEPGQTVAIMGGNGSGKSTLGLLAAGLLRPTSGEIVRSSGHPPSILFQNPDNQIITVTIERELAFPLECHKIEPVEIRRRVDETLTQSGFTAMRDRSPSELSGGEKQKLALLSSTIVSTDLLVLDEPFGHLDLRGRDLVVRIILELKELNEDLVILYITQSSDDALLADRLLVLEEGKVVRWGEPSEVMNDRNRCAQLDLQLPATVQVRLLDAELPGLSWKVGRQNVHVDETIPNAIPVAFRNVSFSWDDERRVLDSFCLDFELGGTVGIIGPSGCGKSTLAMLLAGLIEPSDGSIAIDGDECTRERLLELSAYLFQFPERQLSCMSVFDEVALGIRNTTTGSGELEGRVRRWLTAVGLDPEIFLDRAPALLSGGEMRKVMLASILAMERSLTILDEPTSGLDHAAGDSIRRILDQLKKQKHNIILISHDADFVFEVSNRLVIMTPQGAKYLADKMALADNLDTFRDAGVAPPKVLKFALERGLMEHILRTRICTLAQLLHEVELKS